MEQQNINNLIHSITKAMHFNEKLADASMGADATLHQCIEDELNSVVNTLKITQKSTNNF
tara:strand:+ start:2001 stop:2180 length:180 start_codon:yes stop_codon:yes gene_type:complete